MMVARRAIVLTVLAVAITACTSTSNATKKSGVTSAATSPDATASVPSAAPQKLPTGVLSSVHLDTGGGPAPVTAAFGSVWVANHRSSTLYRIDPRRDAILARIDLNQDTCGPIVAGAGRIWTAPCDDSTKAVVVDPRTNQVVGSTTLITIFGFASGGGWGATLDGATHRFDPKTLRIGLKLPVVTLNGVIAGGHLWLAGGDPDTGQYNGVLTKVDAGTGKIIGRIRTPATHSFPFFTAAAGTLWLKGATDPFLIRIDTATGHVSRVGIPNFHPLESFGDAIPYAAIGSLWLRTAAATVSRLDARTGRVTGTYPADPTSGGGYVAVADGSVWVANFDNDTVWRDKI